MDSLSWPFYGNKDNVFGDGLFMIYSCLTMHKTFHIKKWIARNYLREAGNQLYGNDISKFAR